MRYQFGAGLADFVVQPSDGTWQVGANAVITFWDSATEGTQYADLLDAASQPTTQIKADQYGGIPSFSGPDGVLGMWADAGGSARAWVEAHNVGNTSTPARSVLDWVSVRDHGAQGDGVTDDTAAIQAAITTVAAAGGGTLYVPAGRYILTDSLAWASGVNAVGAGDRVSVLQVTDPNKDCIVGTDISDVTLQGLQLSGPGRGFGSGLRFTRYSAPTTATITLRDIVIQSMGGDGVFCHQLAGSTLHRVRVRTCGGVGIHLQAPQDTILGGASTSLIACSVEGCVTGGYWLDGMAYSTLTSCAVQQAPFGYRLDTCTAIALTGCGAEQCTTGLIVYGGSGAVASSFASIASDGTSVWVTNAAKGVVLTGVTEVAPGSAATTCLRTDASTAVTTLGLTAVKPNALAGAVINPS
ncbi:glycosyl hydrolase family 28-related protein [Streptomyces murinus]|uniref:glycosyl hydrolase family 28-related protein n=1 Tax=Streptomyces murinus TaxID=33900 RepID=UPI002E14D293|nr:glycoside hydrolase family 55 protein [Streptomyces murinus]